MIILINEIVHPSELVSDNSTAKLKTLFLTIYETKREGKAHVCIKAIDHRFDSEMLAIMKSWLVVEYLIYIY